MHKVFFIGIAVIILGGAFLYYSKDNKGALPSFINASISTYRTNQKYIIKKANQIVDSAATLEEAEQKAKGIKRSIAINTYTGEWVYCDLKPYFIMTDTALHDFENFYEAYKYAQNYNYDRIYYQTNKKVIWQRNAKLKGIKLQVPHVFQLPELPRGCEVTSLAMLLQYRGIKADKLKLAQEVKKDETNYVKGEKGRIYYGNPYDGFVGDMYDMSKKGYGVYHGPITELAQSYSPEGVIDLTGMAFEDMLYFIEQGNPVWVITNSTFKPLDETYFEMWHTPTGIVKITKKLHAVVITGFTETSVYINDPLGGKSNKSLNREDFKLAWEQLGNQAVTIIR